MVATKNERLSKAYVDNAVDTAMDAQRQYSENLFSKAEKRVSTLVDEKLKLALSTIRPEESVDLEPVRTKMPYVIKQNAECLDLLKARLSALVTQYEISTGFRVRCVYFEQGKHGFPTKAKPLVYNPE
jgi:hypothetical protein